MKTKNTFFSFIFSFIFAIFFFTLPAPTSAVTEVSGTITSDTVWTATESPYIVGSNFVVEEGATLFMNPGVVVKFESGVRPSIRGKIFALGTPEAPIIFTSVRDDAFLGDTNGDGNTTLPSASFGWTMNFKNITEPSVFEHVRFSYLSNSLAFLGARGEFSNTQFSDSTSGIWVDHGSALFSSVSFRNIRNEAVLLTGGSETLSNDLFLESIGDVAILIFESFAEFNHLHADHLSDSGMEIFDGSAVLVTHSIIEHTEDAAIELYGSTLSLEDSKLSSGLSTGIESYQSSFPISAPSYISLVRSDIDGFFETAIQSYDSSFSIIDSGIRNNGGGIEVYGRDRSDTTFVVRNSSIEGNLNGISAFPQGAALGTMSILARNNWWGDVSGPYHPVQNPDGMGDEVNDFVDFTPWLLEEPAVASPLTLTNPTETEDDGNQDTKGVADKTNFTFSVTVDGAPDSVSLIVVSETGTTTLPLSPRLDLWEIVSTFPKGHYTWHFEATSGAEIVRTADQVFTTGYSNVAFLPGLEASRLYRTEVLRGRDEDQLWEPTRNQDVEELYLDPTTGESVGSNIYTRDVIGSAYGLMNIYSSFIEFMNGLKTDGTIHDWEKLPYDWRFDYEKLLTNGKKTGENISYLEATSTPFILQELHRLAEDSDTGKVTIITHSNGGLVAKYLLKKLELENDPLLPNIDKLIMVAAPQIGTPGAIEGLLHGDEQQFPNELGIFMDEEHSRELGENMQSAYNLLPSQKYFETVQSPVIEFEPNDPITHTFSTLYGETINTSNELRNFLLGDPQSGTHRTEPAPDDEESPNVLKPQFLDRATENHDTMIDDWAPPASMEVVQIAGWGIKTLSGVHYSCGLLTCSSLSTLDRDILQTHVGDGTVVIPSALYMSTSTPNVQRYFVNINEHNKELFRTRTNRDHSDILEIEPLRDFIKNIIQNNHTPQKHITENIPPLGLFDTSLDFRLHSPVALHLYDNEGNHTGRIPNPIPGSDFRAYEARLPNSYYREYGETKYAGADTFATMTVRLVGEALGSFTFDIDETLGDTLIASTTWKDIPVTASSTLTLDIQTLASPAVLLMDVDGDGITDTALAPGDGVTEQEFIAILKGIVKILNLPVQKETKLLKKVEKLEKELAKEHKNEKQEKRKTAKVFEEIIKQIKKFEKKKLLTAEETGELLEIVAKIQASVVK